MTNRRTLMFSIFATAVIALCLPVLAAAQGTYDPWGRNRNGGYGGGYDERYVRDSIHRLDRLAKDFEKEVDRNLDRSRRDGTRREDQINAEANQFRDAVGDLKSAFGNGRDLNRSRDEAQRVFQEARQVERIGMARGYNNRLGSLWSQIRNELNVISNVYGNYGYNNGGYNPNDRRNRTNNNNDWWNRIPWPNR
ncbi:MAG TPA: hypothetical protein VJU86_23555 [Pyrinomonadaceae bacterium]|nr:hypothetical protein [Pyrinomonadaceae bacterium]